MASTLEQFLATFQLDDEYASWKNSKSGLSEADFLASLNGSDGQQDLGQPVEPFWVSCLGMYDTGADFRPLIQRIVLPTGVFIENNRQLMDGAVLSEAVNIRVSSSKPMQIRSEVDGFRESIGEMSSFVLTGNPNNTTFEPIAFMNQGGKQHKLYIPKSSIVAIVWENEPTDSVDFAFTLELQKIKDTPKDTAILNSVSGWFYVEDSVKGFLRDANGNKLAVELGSILHHQKTDFAMNRQGDFNKWFNDVYTANSVSIGYHLFETGVSMQKYIFALKNRSNISRTLVLTPLSNTGWAEIKKPPQNMTKEGNSWVISFSPSQGEVGAL